MHVKCNLWLILALSFDQFFRTVISDGKCRLTRFDESGTVGVLVTEAICKRSIQGGRSSRGCAKSLSYQPPISLSQIQYP